MTIAVTTWELLKESERQITMIKMCDQFFFFFFSASIVSICPRTGVSSSSERSSCLPSKKQRDLDKSDRGDLPYSEKIDFILMVLRSLITGLINHLSYKALPRWWEAHVWELKWEMRHKCICLHVCGHSHQCHCLYAYKCVHLAEDSHKPER